MLYNSKPKMEFVKQYQENTKCQNKILKILNGFIENTKVYIERFWINSIWTSNEKLMDNLVLGAI